MLIVVWILCVLLIVIALFWAAAFLFTRGSIALPSVTEGLDGPVPEGGWPRLSIIVPAHNEQQVIDQCLNSLRQSEYENLQLVVVLDRCTDGTSAVVDRHIEADPRVKSVSIDTLHEDWSGKCYPMHMGVENADGTWLLFIDADAQMDGRLARAAVCTAIRRQFDMMGVLPRVRCRRPFEYIAQPVAQMQLMQIFPPDKINRRHRPRSFGIGTFILVRRETFEKVGGMSTFKSEFQDDLNLARAIKRVRGNVGVVQSDGLLRSVMYDSLGEFIQGWKRIFIGCCKRKVTRLRTYGFRLLAIGVAAPLVQLVAVTLGVLLILQGRMPMAMSLFGAVTIGWIIQATFLLRVYRLLNVPWFAVLAYPLGCSIVGRMLLGAADDLRRRVPFRWGGREYVIVGR